MTTPREKVITRLRAVVTRIKSNRSITNSKHRMKRNNSTSSSSTNFNEHNQEAAREKNEDDPLLMNNATKNNKIISSYGATTTENKEVAEEVELGTKGEVEPPPMTNFAIIAILSTSFSCSCLLTTFFIVVAPIECQRIQTETTEMAQFYQSDDHNNDQGHSHNVVNKSIALGCFAAVAGFTQLIKPIIGLLSDCYGAMLEKKYEKMYRTLDMLGKRMPYIILGTFMVIVGVCGQMWSRRPIHTFVTDDNGETIVMGGAWIQYTIFLLITMFGSNIVYTIMFVLIPDLVPPSQTGVSNGILALLVVSGALFGFFMFDLLENSVMGMYQMYIITSSLCAMLTFIYVFERENILKRMKVDVPAATDNDRYYYDSSKSAIEGEKESQRIQSSSMSTSTKNTSLNMNSHDAVAEERQSNKANSIVSDIEEQEKNTEKASLNLPPLHGLIYILLYEPIMNKSRSELVEAYWIDTSKHRDFFIVTISRFFYYMGISSQTFFLYYIHDVLRQSARTANPEAAIVLLAIVGQSSGAITCYPVGLLSDKCMGGRRKPFVYTACILLALGNIGLLYCKTLSDMIGVCAVLGAANGAYLTMDTSLAVDTLDSDEGEVVNNNNDDASTINEYVNDEEGGNSEREDVSTSTNIDFDEEVKAMLPQSKKKKGNHNHGAAQLLGVWGVFGFVGSALGPLIGGTALLLLGKTATNSGTTVTSGGDVTGNNIFPSSPFYKFQGYEALYSLSAFYFFCSALSLALVRKKGV
mmetsp:Transcript_12075/g.18349  ORF Transcript_12075/g.18349 Transcript_12075/m.18349 type:complete len:753 (+) Transcript_12075:159-2417(+)